MNVYEERQAARKARYEARAAAAAAESTEKANLSHKMASAIPFGQPVHGPRDRNYRDKIGKQMDKAIKAGTQGRLLAAESRGRRAWWHQLGRPGRSKEAHHKTGKAHETAGLHEGRQRSTPT